MLPPYCYSLKNLTVYWIRTKIIKVEVRKVEVYSLHSQINVPFALHESIREMEDGTAKLG